MDDAMNQLDAFQADATNRQIRAKAAILQWQAAGGDALFREVVMLSLEWQWRAWRKRLDALLSRDPIGAKKLQDWHERELLKARELIDLVIRLRPEIAEPTSGLPPSWIGPSQ